MLGRQERIAFVLLVGVAVTVVTAHALFTLIGKQPFAHPYTENSPDGDLVLVQGIISRASLIENGGHLSVVVNNTTVFIPSAAAQGLVVHKGDTIVAYGIVQTYRGKKEIVIGSAEDIRITTIP